MSHTKLMRLGGLGGLLTSGFTLLVLLGRVARIVPDSFDNPRGMVTFILLIFTMIALYARQYDRAGVIGLAGLVLTVTALIYNVAFRYIQTFIAPPLVAGNYTEAATAIFSGPINSFIMFVWLMLPVGYLLFAMATFRANVLPRWATLLVAIGPVINYIGVMSPLVSQIGSLILYIGLLWLSWGLFVSAGEKVQAVQARAVTE